MNVQSLEGSWKILKGKLRQRFAKWLGDEAKYQEGKETELIGRILKGSPGKADDPEPTETTERENATTASCESCRR